MTNEQVITICKNAVGIHPTERQIRDLKNADIHDWCDILNVERRGNRRELKSEYDKLTTPSIGE